MENPEIFIGNTDVFLDRSEVSLLNRRAIEKARREDDSFRQGFLFYQIETRNAAFSLAQERMTARIEAAGLFGFFAEIGEALSREPKEGRGYKGLISGFNISASLVGSKVDIAFEKPGLALRFSAPRTDRPQGETGRGRIYSLFGRMRELSAMVEAVSSAVQTNPERARAAFKPSYQEDFFGF